MNIGIRVVAIDRTSEAIAVSVHRDTGEITTSFPAVPVPGDHHLPRPACYQIVSRSVDWGDRPPGVLVGVVSATRYLGVAPKQHLGSRPDGRCCNQRSRRAHGGHWGPLIRGRIVPGTRTEYVRAVVTAPD